MADVSNKQGVDDTLVLANKIVTLLDEAARESHPATAVLALQVVVASMLNVFRIPTGVFMEHVDNSRKELFNG
jgi:hypothetical protein